MKALRACLLALFVASAVPVSAEPIAMGEFAFTVDTLFPDIFQWFSVASFLSPGHPLAGLTWSATVVTTAFDGSELSLPLFDTSGDGLLEAGESALTDIGAYLGSVQSARLDFGSLTGFSASILTLPFDVSDPAAVFIEPGTIFYDPAVASVPEPGTLLLLGIGMALAAYRGRCRFV